jgi:hypothetical protein
MDVCLNMNVSVYILTLKDINMQITFLFYGRQFYLNSEL